MGAVTGLQADGNTDRGWLVTPPGRAVSALCLSSAPGLSLTSTLVSRRVAASIYYRRRRLAWRCAWSRRCSGSCCPGAGCVAEFADLRREQVTRPLLRRLPAHAAVDVAHRAGRARGRRRLVGWRAFHRPARLAQAAAPAPAAAHAPKSRRFSTARSRSSAGCSTTGRSRTSSLDMPPEVWQFLKSRSSSR